MDPQKGGCLLDDTVSAQLFTSGRYRFVHQVDVDLYPEGDGFHDGDGEFFSRGFSSSSEGNQHFAAGGALLHQL